MAAGGDQYTMFVDKAIINHSSALDEAVIAYIQNHSNLALKVEGRIIAKNEAPIPAPQPSMLQTGVYIVKLGDNLSRIALSYDTVWQELQKLNNLKNPNLIFPGQKLIVPQK